MKSDKENILESSVQYIKSVGPKRAESFSKIGITNVVEGYGQPKRYDPDMDIHHHFRCIQCNSIIDFHNREYDNITVPDEINKQFTVISKKVVLEGLCSKCRKG